MCLELANCALRLAGCQPLGSLEDCQAVGEKLSEPSGNHLVVFQNKGTLISPPKYENLYYGDPNKVALILGNLNPKPYMSLYNPISPPNKVPLIFGNPKP